jgi:hypothetical protein
MRYPTEAFPAQLRERHPIGIPNVGKSDRSITFTPLGHRCSENDVDLIRRGAASFVDHHATLQRHPEDILSQPISCEDIETLLNVHAVNVGNRVNNAFTNGWMTTDPTFDKKCSTFCHGILFGE